MKRIAILVILLVAVVSGAAGAESWADRIKLGGDFRDRYDGVWDETKDYDRHRNRIRARFGFKVTITDDFTFASRFATGINDPASTNRTMTDAFTTKGYWLDLAYFEYHPVKIKGFKAWGGKMKNLFYKPAKQQLVWDGDVNPEGLAVTFGRDASEKISFFVSGSWFSVMERKADPDIYMLGGQGGLKIKAADNVKVTVGVSYYGYENLKGSEALFDGEFFGNSTVDDGGTDVFANDYELVEGFGEVGIKAEKAGISLWGAYVNNTEADSLNIGYLFGIGVKGGKDKGAWKLSVFYKYVETDAVIGLFADSDFGGGTTDVKGFALSGGYALQKNVELASTLHINERGVEDGTSYTRLFVDLKFKF